MDNHGKPEVSHISARAMTEEIERATNAEQERQQLENAAGGGRSEYAGITPEQTRQFGETVISSAELARDRQEIAHPDEYIGDESALQIRERLAEDRDDLRRELGEGLKFEAKIAKRGQERITADAVHEVDQLMGRANFRPAEMAAIYRKYGNQLLSAVENRRIGDRNNAA